MKSFRGNGHRIFGDDELAPWLLRAGRNIVTTVKSSISFTRIPFLPAYFKAEPSRHASHYRGGRLKNSGPGITGFFFAATDALASVPLSVIHCPFSLACTTADHQEVTVQGNCTFVISDPAKAAVAIDFSVDSRGNYVSDDPIKLPDRLVVVVAALARRIVVQRELMNLLASPGVVEEELKVGLATHEALLALGITYQGTAVTAVAPASGIAQALEARRRESLHQEADQAIHDRQMAAEAQDRALRQEQFLSQKLMQQGEQEVMEARMALQKRESALGSELQGLELQKDAEKSLHQRLEREKSVEAGIALEARRVEAESGLLPTRRTIVEAEAQNKRTLGQAEGENLKATMEAMAGIDPRVIQALALRGAGTEGTIAAAFLGLAERAGEIGTLNITPDLLDTLMKKPKPEGK